ncbi:bifunctional phosphopantothenoylcysteine decarboxylase/phosphopantothenate--cysteine ligase CoaBC [Gulosibacter molinativorax]|uniref:Coenzyme A biosynthesis bifunctional protein CoaBC n=1 Tax=Gulosibacter molinativorax TaxID=256821 RepID=A0ABT7C7E7_9MICO|nr:bifunctional phosphopantothenoylcysteine decarboxylase/phosphopantothenate--cysteine ligase CoaBC [Gulosibacter molinativorax]MDJ1371072.1 bifunctional phosphopantothenoylcysteine decarboxylase/phosphopantothenate--cysteine ligase CoaBC [Gulosibacter molinativorax]QUY61432.1 Putative DNA/pantothenate metabolism flavoprotein [Gulosibacter molinativorax]
MSVEEAQSPAWRIVVGVTGGIAAYKAVSVIRSLVLLGHHVDVIATKEALRFVGAPTLEAISRNPIRTDIYENVATVQHVAIGQAADVIAVVPATANTIAKLSVGLADDLLTNTILASLAPVVVAPAMHTEMWQHPATQANVHRLHERGVTLVGPDSGRLTGKDEGPGRLAETDEIVNAILAAARRGARERHNAELERDLVGRDILVTAGGTREPIDPVRFLGNRSSGKQGVALAQRAAERGADVTLLAANIEVPVPDNVHVVRVSSAEQLAAACAELAPRHDTIIMAAAVADFRPEHVQTGKIKKESTGEELTLTFKKNPDILRNMVATRVPGQTIVGFAAETEEDDAARLEIARAKIKRKGCDYLVLNRVGWDHGFGREETEVQVLNLEGDVVQEAVGDKTSVANAILDVVRARD